MGGWPVTRPSTIYAIRCKENGRVYIGRTYRLEGRIKEHFNELRRIKKTTYESSKHSLSQFQVDFNIYGESAFEVYVLEENVPPEDCRERESYWIAEYNSTNPEFGYNRLTERIIIDHIPINYGCPPKSAVKEINQKLKESGFSVVSV